MRKFDPLSADFFDDPYDTYRWLRDEVPVYYSEQYGFWALSRYADVVKAHRDWQTFTSTKGITLDQLAHADIGSLATGSIIFMDPPDHERLRRLVSRVFTPKAVADLEPMVRGSSRSTWTRSSVSRRSISPLISRDRSRSR